jgi:20S proteasome alpha/beta subunit
MHTIDLDRDELFKLIKKAVREVVQEEMSRVWLENLAAVTDEEQEDISRRHGRPERPREIESRETVDL